MNGDTLVNEKDIEKSYEAVARPFNFKNIKELIALLQQFFYINYFSSENGGENLLKKKISETLGYELELYCDVGMDKESIRERFQNSLPEIGELVMSDMEAAYRGDPAANSIQEIMAAYPGPFAVMVQRAAHKLYDLQTPILPRIMTEYAHSVTGIDIHPGASIGEGFFIDHGTGVVIGETTIIGNNVKIYQGVTLGALSTKGGQRLKCVKRHPTVEDDVTIYAGATILGGNTVIGRGSVIGGNTWITESVPMYSKVFSDIVGMKIQKISGGMKHNGFETN